MARIDVPFVIEKLHITQPTHDVLTSGGQNYFYAIFKTDEIWSNISDIRAVFRQGDVIKRMSLTETEKGYECRIPWEVMTDTGLVYVGIVGGDRLPTDYTYVRVSRGCDDEGTPPEPPTPDWFDKVEKEIADLEKSLNDIVITGGGISEERVTEIVTEELENAKASGEFDGEDGISCEHSWNGTILTVKSASGTSSADLKGDKGEDYVLTDEDKASIVNDVLSNFVNVAEVGR